MGKILDYIAQETQGRCFTSYKYCFDTETVPHILYDDAESSYINLKDYAESSHDPNSRDMGPLSKELANCAPLFRFFLDGSRKVYKIDDIQYDNKVYPVVSGQISVACCERIMKDDCTFGAIHHISEEVYPVLCLPVKANMEGKPDNLFFNNLCNKINENLSAVNRPKLKKILYYSTQIQGKQTLENNAIAKVQDEMVECEKSIVAQLTAKHLLTEDQFLIKDGSIQYKPMKTGDFKEISKIRSNYRHVVGVSKSFNPNLMKDRRGQSNAGEIARLPLFHRTPAFLWQPGSEWGDVNFAIWYVRIRDRKYTATPYSGIVKVEKMLMTGAEHEHGLQTDEINLITANIINERLPVCYGNDSRWANHLYPVYMTESYCKSRFLSDPYFINMF